MHLYHADPSAIVPRKRPRFAATESEHGCDSGTRIYELGPRYEGKTFITGQFIWGDDPSAVCRLRVAADGQVRCLPGALEPTTAFTDEACTDAVASSSIASPFGAVVLALDDARRTHVYEMNGTYYGATYRRDVDGVCIGGGSGSGTLAGAELSPELFPRYELAWGD